VSAAAVRRTVTNVTQRPPVHPLRSRLVTSLPGWWLALVMACIGGGAAPASAATDKLRIDIDLSSQTMRVDAGFFSRYTWRVSTARPG